MKDAGVGLERLLRREVTLNHGVGAQRHRDGGHNWEEESGQRCGGVRRPSALAPAYQYDNLYMLVVRIFIRVSKFFIFYNFRKQNTCV